MPNCPHFDQCVASCIHRTGSILSQKGDIYRENVNPLQNITTLLSKHRNGCLIICSQRILERRQVLKVFCLPSQLEVLIYKGKACVITAWGNGGKMVKTTASETSDTLHLLSCRRQIRNTCICKSDRPSLCSDQAL